MLVYQRVRCVYCVEWLQTREGNHFLNHFLVKHPWLDLVHAANHWLDGWTFSPSQRGAKIPCFKLLPGETLDPQVSNLFLKAPGQIDGKITRIITINWINCMFFRYFWYVLAFWHRHMACQKPTARFGRTRLPKPIAARLPAKEAWADGNSSGHPLFFSSGNGTSSI